MPRSRSPIPMCRRRYSISWGRRSNFLNPRPPNRRREAMRLPPRRTTKPLPSRHSPSTFVPPWVIRPMSPRRSSPRPAAVWTWCGWSPATHSRSIRCSPRSMPSRGPRWPLKSCPASLRAPRCPPTQACLRARPIPWPMCGATWIGRPWPLLLAR
ncbi:Uncharacterised protein [Mycobacteroides abscessus subsp. abscessus]|nr:Uncharacterised protein [Mycobacteroides abscessus subsp. abscessus]